jgi:hypothetical protein
MGWSYPDKLEPIITYDKVSPTIRQQLIAELKDSRYTKDMVGIFDFLRVAAFHITMRHDSTPLVVHIISDKDISLIRLRRIFRRASCVLSTFPSKHAESITMWLIPAPVPRAFPKKGEEFAAQHINGGYTYVSHPTIYIFREEELPKVLLHELLHNTILDTSPGQWDTADLKQLLNIHPTMELLPNEAVIEAWAEIFHCWCIAHELHLPFSSLIEAEQSYSLAQANNLLKYQERYFPLWKEDTNAYCYFVIRSALLWRYQDLVRMKVPYNVPEMMRLIRSVLTDKAYVHARSGARAAPSGRMTLLGDI